MARKLKFHYTSMHGSWLNIAEIELAALSSLIEAPRDYFSIVPPCCNVQ